MYKVRIRLVKASADATTRPPARSTASDSPFAAAPPTTQGTEPHAVPYAARSARERFADGAMVTERTTRSGRRACTASAMAGGGVRGPRSTTRAPAAARRSAAPVAASEWSSSAKHATSAVRAPAGRDTSESIVRAATPSTDVARCSDATERRPARHSAPMRRSAGTKAPSKTPSASESIIARDTSSRSSSAARRRDASTMRSAASDSAASPGRSSDRSGDASASRAASEGGTPFARSSTIRCTRATSSSVYNL